MFDDVHPGIVAGLVGAFISILLNKFYDAISVFCKRQQVVKSMQVLDNRLRPVLKRMAKYDANIPWTKEFDDAKPMTELVSWYNVFNLLKLNEIINSPSSDIYATMKVAQLVAAEAAARTAVDGVEERVSVQRDGQWVLLRPPMSPPTSPAAAPDRLRALPGHRPRSRAGLHPCRRSRATAPAPHPPPLRYPSVALCSVSCIVALEHHYYPRAEAYYPQMRKEEKKKPVKKEKNNIPFEKERRKEDEKKREKNRDKEDKENKKNEMEKGDSKDQEGKKLKKQQRRKKRNHISKSHHRKTRKKGVRKRRCRTISTTERRKKLVRRRTKRRRRLMKRSVKISSHLRRTLCIQSPPLFGGGGAATFENMGMGMKRMLQPIHISLSWNTQLT